MATPRDLAWEGCGNVRDLGGLVAANGRTVRPGAVVRADSPHRLTDAGWQAAWDHGVRTVVDLRHDRERADDPPRGNRPEGIDVVHSPIEVEDDLDFIQTWGHQLGTPRYYPAALERYAHLNAGAVRAVAMARPGGVLVHCVAGRDRTGLISLLLLALVGVPAATIAADHAASYDLWRVGPGSSIDDADEPTAGHLLDPNAAAVGAADRPGDWRDHHDAALITLLARVDVDAYLRAGGVGDDHLHALRVRLLADPV